MAITAIKDLSDADAGCGTIAYNGYPFPGLRNYTLSIVPVEDDAKRTVTHQCGVLELVFWVWSATEDDSSADMESIRDTLAAAGKTLQITDIGFGDLVINQATGGTPAGTHVDVLWGPKPGPLRAIPVGGAIAWECHWSIEFNINPCAVGYSNLWLAFNYGLSYAINHKGLQRRTVSGYYQIEQTRDLSGSRTVQRSADEVWNSLKVVVPEDFRRTSCERTISPDKNRCDFSIVDEQLDGFAPPAGMITAQVRDTFESIPPGFAKWRAALTCDFETVADQKPAAAAIAFLALATDKAQKLRKAAGQKRPVLPTKLRMERDRLSRASSFAIEWTVVACLSDLVTSSGLWEPLPNTNWAKWSASMRGAWEPRGFAGLRHKPTEDTIVDLCAGISAAQIGDGVGYRPGNIGKASGALTVEDVDEEHSWLAYENRLIPYREQELVAHKPVTAFTPPQPPTSHVGASIVGEVDVAFWTASAGTTPDVLQYRGGPTDLVLMQGKSMRLKFRPAVPQLLQVEGVPVVEVKSRIDGPKVLACFFDVPVYVVRWAILYRVDGYLSAIKEQATPALCCDPVMQGQTS